MKKIKLDVKINAGKENITEALEFLGIAEMSLAIHGTFDKQRANVPIRVTISHNNIIYNIVFAECNAYLDDKMINMTKEEKDEIVFKAFNALNNEE